MALSLHICATECVPFYIGIEPSGRRNENLKKIQWRCNLQETREAVGPSLVDRAGSGQVKEKFCR